MPLHRFRIRTLMTAVAVAAIVCAGSQRTARLCRQRESYRRLGRVCRVQALHDEKLYLARLKMYNSGDWCGSHQALLDSERDHRAVPIARRRAAELDNRADLCERAIYRPWLPLPPDLPEPK